MFSLLTSAVAQMWLCYDSQVLDFQTLACKRKIHVMTCQSQPGIGNSVSLQVSVPHLENNFLKCTEFASGIFMYIRVEIV